MNPEKFPNQTDSTYAPHGTAAVLPLSTANVHLTESDKRKTSNIWAPLYALGVFGCMYLLFHLYVSTTFHHAALDHGLHRVEEEVHAIMEMHHTSGNVTVPSTVNAPVHRGNHRALADHVRERRHKKSSKRAKSRMIESQPVKRGGSTLTWFHPGVGACGGHNGDNDYIIAISYLIWNGGAHCGDAVTITYHGKTVQATVADECMGCDPGHIDLSPGLLRFLTGPGKDMVTDANWLFGDAEPPKPKPEPKPKPTTTHHDTTTEDSTSTSTSSTSSSSSSTESSSSAVSTSALAIATPVAYGDDGQVHNIEAFNVLLVNIGSLVVYGAAAEE